MTRVRTDREAVATPIVESERQPSSVIGFAGRIGLWEHGTLKSRACKTLKAQPDLATLGKL
jgi:hypothetical protein